MQITRVLLSVLSIVCIAPASAAPGDEVDDVYVGFQLRTGLEPLTSRRVLGGRESGFFVIGPQGGQRHGFALWKDAAGHRTFGYLPPGSGFDVVSSYIADAALPVYRLEAAAESVANRSSGNGGAGLVALLAIGLILKHDLEKKWQPAD